MASKTQRERAKRLRETEESNKVPETQVLRGGVRAGKVMQQKDN